MNSKSIKISKYSIQADEGGGGTTPPAISPLVELELREKKRACRPLRDATIDTQI